MKSYFCFTIYFLYGQVLIQFSNLKQLLFLFFSLSLPLKLIKVDKTTGEPLRDENGFCIKCQPNEEGEFIGKIVRGDPVKGIVHLNNYFRLHCPRFHPYFTAIAVTLQNFIMLIGPKAFSMRYLARQS